MAILLLSRVFLLLVLCCSFVVGRRRLARDVASIDALGDMIVDRLAPVTAEATTKTTKTTMASEQQQQFQDDEVLELEQRRQLKMSLRRMQSEVSPAKSAEEHRVNSLPGLSSEDASKLKQYAGMIEIDAAKSSNIFYWLVEKDGGGDNAPLLIWLNGGPGCTSMDGMWLELGPFHLDGAAEDQVKLNPYSWHKAANVLFIDQPVGTGFSHTKSKDGYAHNDDAVNRAFYTFMQRWYALHPKFAPVGEDDVARSSPLFFAGESHAGHYIPNFVTLILDQNAIAGAKLIIDVKGAALGNPWIDPAQQYDVSDYAHGLGLVSRGQSNNLKEMHERCKALLKTGRLNQHICFELLDIVLDSAAAGGSHRMIMYDIRKFWARTSSFPPGHEALERYMNKPDVRSALHVTGNQKFEECADPPYNALAHQDGKSAKPELEKVVRAGVRLLLYSGQYDMVCNHLGSEDVLDSLDWDGKLGWIGANSGVWVVDKDPAGYVKKYKNLQSILVLDAGHMVPMDQPKRSLDMISRWLNDKPLTQGSVKLSARTNPPPNSMCPPHRRMAQDGSAAVDATNDVEDSGRVLHGASSSRGRAGRSSSATASSVVHEVAASAFGETALFASILTVGAVAVLLGGYFCIKAVARGRK